MVNQPSSKLILFAYNQTNLIVLQLFMRVEFQYFKQSSVIRQNKEKINNNIRLMAKSTQSLGMIIAIAVLLIIGSKCDCFLSHYPTKTTFGSIHADLDPNQPQQLIRSQVYSYPLQSQILSVSPNTKAAVAVAGFSVEKRAQQFGYKVSYSFPPGPTIDSIVFTVSFGSTDRWRYLLIYFIVPDNQDFLAGYKTVYHYMPTSQPNVNKIIDSVSLPNVNFAYKAKAKIFISGLEIKQKNVLSQQNLQKVEQVIKKIKQLRNYSWNQKLLRRFTSIAATGRDPNMTISQVEITRSGQLTMQVYTSQIELKALSYSYLIYLERTAPKDIIYFATSGQFLASDDDKFYYDSIQYDQMTMLGMSGLKFANGLIGQFNLQIEKFRVDTFRKFYYTKIEGENSQFKMQYFGIQVIPGSVCANCPGSPIIYSQFCVSKCPSGFVVGTNSDGAFYCHQCNMEQLLIADQDKKACVCAYGHYLISPTVSCTQCPYDCLTCNGNTCLSCDTPSQSSFRILNRNTGRCQCPPMNSAGNGLFDDIANQNRRCIQCNPRCKTCRGPEINQCTSCGPKRTLINGICKCDQNFVQNQRNQCICTSPYSLNQLGKCVLVQNKCQQNEFLTIGANGQRVCLCRQGFIRGLLSNRCVRQCQPSEQLNQQTQKCECRTGFVRNATTLACYACSSRLNQVYNEYLDKCECLSGFQLNMAGQCSSCPPKMYYNRKSDKCQCVFNYYQASWNGPCIKCKNQWDSPSCKSLGTIQRLQL